MSRDDKILLGKKPQHRNGKLKPLSKGYDPELARRRNKEKRRRIAEKKRRRIEGR